MNGVISSKDQSEILKTRVYVVNQHSVNMKKRSLFLFKKSSYFIHKHSARDSKIPKIYQ